MEELLHKFKNMSRVALKLNTLTVDEKLTLARRIHENLVSNAATFAGLAVLPADLLLQINSVDAAHQKTLNGGKAETTIRNTELKVLKQMLTTLAANVQAISVGDATIINQAGMDVAAIGPKMYESITPITGLEAFATDMPGQLRLRWDSDKYAKAYAIQYSVGTFTEDTWKNGLYCTRSQMVIPNLPSGQVVWFRVLSICAAGVSAWSEPVSKRVS
jgi:hypothetical protein